MENSPQPLKLRPLQVPPIAVPWRRPPDGTTDSTDGATGSDGHWRYLRPKRPMVQGYGSGNIPRIHANNMVRLRTSILGSWNSHWDKVSHDILQKYQKTVLFQPSQLFSQWYFDKNPYIWPRFVASTCDQDHHHTDQDFSCKQHHQMGILVMGISILISRYDIYIYIWGSSMGACPSCGWIECGNGWKQNPW